MGDTDFRQAALFALTLASAPATASVITFGPLVGGNGSPYAGHNEVGFTVANNGNWLEAQIFGNGVPSIYTNAATDSIGVSRTGGGVFTFGGVDLACNNGSNCGFSILGFLGAAQVLAQLGPVTAGPPFTFFTLGGAGTVIDSLVIGMTAGTGTTTMNIDNIQVNATVPEPGTLGLLLTGMIGAALLRRFRR